MSRDAAKAQGSLTYFTGKPCRRGHLAERYTSKATCMDCNRLANTEYRARNSDSVSARTKQWREENRDRHISNRRAWRAANPDKKRASAARHYLKHMEEKKAYQAKWRAENRERHRQMIADWHKRNPHRSAQTAMRRYVFQRRAIAGWANQAEILKFYELAAQISIDTGVAHQVDHIVPIVSPNVCGLHCEANLQIMTALDNQRKSNCFWPDMP